MNKVVLIGCGNVGMSYAYALVTTGIDVDELVLIDVNKEKAQGEALDLNHALSYAPRNMKIYAGDYSDCNTAQIVCICAGRNQEVGETRTDLIYKNYEVFKSIISEVNKTKFDGFYLIATNPLDTMTYITYKLSNFPAHKVIGSGTTLDTSRLRYLIGQELSINPKNVHGYVIGEHGDTEFVPWENIMIGCNKVTEFLSDEQMHNLEYEVKTSAYDIIAKKGNTSYGIGMCLQRITNALLDNTNEILTVSAYDKENDIYYAKPCLVNEKGASQPLFINLSEEDNKKLQHSINTLKEIKKLIK